MTQQDMKAWQPGVESLGYIFSEPEMDFDKFVKRLNKKKREYKAKGYTDMFVDNYFQIMGTKKEEGFDNE